MNVPRWAFALLCRLAPPAGAEDVLGDLEEAHRARVKRHGRLVASILTGLEALDMARALIVERIRSRRTGSQLVQSGRGAAGARRRRLGVSWLDFKLGFRMLVKYPGLTLAGGLAIAFAIWASAISFEVFTQVMAPRLPLEDGDRIVGIVMIDAAASDQEYRILHDFAAWREEMRSIEDLGAFRSFTNNLIVAGGPAEPVDGAEMSASAFRVTKATPLLGRTLVEEDERPGAPPVLVIGYDVWRTRFDSDPQIVGQEVRLGNTVHTVVGVMPRGFGFPISQSSWIPFKRCPLDYAQGEGPGIRVFGRLSPGTTIEEAQSELAVIGARAAADYPETHRHLRPQVMPYARSIFGEIGEDDATFAAYGAVSINVLLVLLLLLICGNVALLMLARAATRDNEILVRSALGASARRIIGQLLVEALLLAALAGAVGLAAAHLGLGWIFGVIAGEFGYGRLPFWVHSSLSRETVLYAGLLTVLAGAIAGLLPGLRVTRGLGTRLRQAGPGGGGVRIGGMWTALIVTQVAVMAAIPVFLFIFQREARQNRSRDADLGFPTEEYLSATIAIDQERVPSASAAQLAAPAAAYPELERRLEAEPGVAAVTFADQLPRTWHPFYRIEVDEGGAPGSEDFGAHTVHAATVAPDFFDVLDAPILLGRGFHSGDLLPSARTVIVNQSFVRLILGGRNPIGRRLRDLPLAWSGSEWTSTNEEPDDTTPANPPWYEIVGVVRDMGMASPMAGAGVYHPLAPGGSNPVRIAVHTRGDPLAFVSRMRSIATDVDPTLQLHDIAPLDEVTTAAPVLELLFWITTVLTSVVLLLSLTGIYAVLSFDGSRRTREVGIRIALGGHPRRVAAAMFRRPMMPVGLGIMVGVAVATWLSSGGLVFGVVYGLVILGVSSLAAVVPVRRALRVEPTEALKADT